MVYPKQRTLHFLTHDVHLYVKWLSPPKTIARDFSVRYVLLSHIATGLAVLYLCWAHGRQLTHVKVQDVELQPDRCPAAALQELFRQQLQKLADRTEETRYIVIDFAKDMTWRWSNSTLPALPVSALQHLKGLSEHKANKLKDRGR